MEASNFMADPPTIIKRHATRRLYNTRTGRYVARSHLLEMVKHGERFVVYDTKSGGDITRSVLTQIVREQEGKESQPLLPIEFMRQLILFYGDTLRTLLACYLDFSVLTLASEDMRKQVTQTRASAISLLDGQVRRNIEFFERIVANFEPIPSTDDKSPSVDIRRR